MLMKIKLYNSVKQEIQGTLSRWQTFQVSFGWLSVGLASWACDRELAFFSQECSVLGSILCHQLFKTLNNFITLFRMHEV